MINETLTGMLCAFKEEFGQLVLGQMVTGETPQCMHKLQR